MRSSVQRLRWVLGAGAVLLVAALVLVGAYTRYSALKRWRDFVRRTGVHISHETDGFTYSQSVQGRTIFTVHAAKAVDHGDGKWSLYNAVMTMYGKTGNNVDHIYGNDFEYDKNTGVARAIGEVQMDLQAPGTLGGTKPHASGDAPAPASAATPPRVIHVRTSGLVYVSKLKVAATDEQVEFTYEGLTCVAKGAEFDSGESILRLLADAHLTGTLRGAGRETGEHPGEPIDVRAAKADLNRQSNIITLAQPVVLMHGRTMRSANAVVNLRNDGSVDHVVADGSVTLDAGTRHIAAAHLDAGFNETSQPQAGSLTGGVTFADTSATRPLHGSAQQVDSAFDAAGAPTSIIGTGAAQVFLSDRRGSGPPLDRELHGDRIVATLAPIPHNTTSRLSEVLVTGSAMARGESLAPPTKTVSATPQSPALKSLQVSADSLHATFEPSGSRQASLQHLSGQGHTRLEQNAPGGEQQTSTADTLEAAFTPQPSAQQPSSRSGVGLQLASATQTGHVQIHAVPASQPVKSSAQPQPPVDASADKAVYDSTTAKITLSGAAHFTQGETSLAANTIVVDQLTNDADAQGNVLANMTGQPSGPASASKPSPASEQTSHVSADRAHLSHASGLAEFFASDAHPARLWQGASQVLAADLLFDQKKRSLSARPASPGGLVHGVFASASQPQSKAASSTPTAGQVVRVASPVMDYSDTLREATFSGGVRIDGATGQARSERAVVFLSPGTGNAATAVPKPAAASPAGVFGGSLDRIVLSGDVHLDQPGRMGTGEQLVYNTAESSYILTGTPARPPHMVDAQQGSVTGATLLFKQGDSTIVVSGAPAGAGQPKHGRVRTETGVGNGMRDSNQTEVRQ